MRSIILAIATACAGFLFGFAAAARMRGRRQKRGARKKEQSKTLKVETMKKIVWVCLIQGFLWVWCSYILAWLDKEQIAESLSSVAVTEIIGVVLAYALKSAVENLSKNNNWPDKPAAAAKDETNTDEEGGEASG